MDIKDVEIEGESSWGEMPDGLIQWEMEKLAKLMDNVERGEEEFITEVTDYLRHCHPADFVKQPTLWQRIHRFFTRGRL